jgi:small conductance mechanosensitive channel
MTPEQLQMWTDAAVGWALLGGQALVVLVIGWVVSNTIYARTVAMVQSRGLDLALGRFLAQIARWAILGATIIAALGIVGVEVMGLMAVFASAGVAVGLALQGNLSNFASGVMLLIFRPIDVGDVVTAAGHTGTVQEIGLFSTILHTPANERVIVPNNALTGSTIVNLTALGTRRASIGVGVAYGSDVPQVIGILEQAAKAVPGVLPDPAVAVVFTGLGASSLDFEVRCWAKNPDFFPMQGAVRRAIYDALNDAGIDIPFNQIVVHMAADS